MLQTQTITTLTNVPFMSGAARHQFQQYLSRIPASASASASSSGSSSSSSTNAVPFGLETLFRRSAYLTTRVGDLYSRLSNVDLISYTSSPQEDDPQLFWSTLTLLTNLRELSTQLQRQRSLGSVNRSVDEALERTQQNVAMVESMLGLLSVSSSDQVGDVFAVPLGASSIQAKSNESVTNKASGYEYWRAQTLSALNTDFNSNTTSSSTDDGEADAASETESILTDSEIHPITLNPSSSSTQSVHINHPPPQPTHSDDQEDYSEYDRASSSISSPPLAPPSAPTPAPNGSDTILQSDRATHEALSSELLRMASVLKSNSLAFADSLERDRLLLEKAGTDLGQNLDLMTRTRGRLGVYSKKVRSMGWFTLSAIVTVILSWMLMFLLIRLT